MRTDTSMKTLLAFFLLTSVALAQQPIVVAKLYQGTNQVGFLQKPCADKNDAIALVTKWTNNVSGIAKGLSVAGYLHTCNHDLAKVKPCTMQLVIGKELNYAQASNYHVSVTQVMTDKDLKSLRDNVPQMKIPASKATETTLIQKICTEEFAGKNVTTNAGTTASAVTGDSK